MTCGTGTASAAERPCYVLPLRLPEGRDAAELTAYLRHMAGLCQVIVVDGSPPAVFARHHRAWAAFARHLPPDAGLAYRNGKVNGVITGMRAAGGGALGLDYPGTLAVRRDAFLRAGCYDGDVLFENLELIRTMDACGARVRWAPQAYVRRLPPDAEHFAGQRVRQAYDSHGQPARLALELALLPAIALAVAARRYAALGCAAAAAAGLAEAGRRRNGGTALFPPVTALLAPAWVAERSACSWLALVCRLRGGSRIASYRQLPAPRDVWAFQARGTARHYPGSLGRCHHQVGVLQLKAVGCMTAPCAGTRKGWHAKTRTDDTGR